MRKNLFYRLVFGLFFFYLLNNTLFAQDPTTRGGEVTNVSPLNAVKGETYAIIVGVSKYQKMPALQFADKDAEYFRDFLESPAGGNTKPENIKMYLNEEATYGKFFAEYREWLNSHKLKKDDRLYLYFAGHGDGNDYGEYYFLMNDCVPENDAHNYSMGGAIDMNNVKNTIKYWFNKGVQVILIMDACRTNDLPGGIEGQKARASIEEPVGEILMLATGPNQVSNENKKYGGGHGLYTYYLVNGLYGDADKDEMTGDNNNQVTLTEIDLYTKTKVRKVAKDDFNSTQIPQACCSENNLTPISTFDDQSYASWQTLKKFGNLTADSNSFASNNARPVITRGIGGLGPKDSVQVNIYNQFSEALTNQDLVGYSTADSLYHEMEKRWPNQSLTQDAKYMLVGNYLDFCQQKINLFLSGKGLIHIIYMEKEVFKDKKDTSNLIGDQILKLKTIVNTGYDVAASMMDKAHVLLKNDTTVWESLIPKYQFIKTMAAFAEKNKTQTLKDIQQQCRKLLESDDKSPAGYLLMGWVLEEMKNDSCEYYFKKAASIAPKWVYPINSLGNYYLTKNKYDSAKYYLNIAIELDSLNSSARKSMGMIYFNESGFNYDKRTGSHGYGDQIAFDRAGKYFISAYRIDTTDSYANLYAGDYMQRKFSRDVNTMFDVSKRYYLRAIRYDQNFALAYQKLAALYSEVKMEDSAMATLQRCVDINPTNAEAYRNLGAYYLYTKNDLEKAEVNFKEAIRLDPATDKNYFSLARLYNKQGEKEKAIKVYNEALKNVDYKVDLYNDIANIYFDKLYQPDSAINYYKKALQVDSTLAFVYYNLAKLNIALSNNPVSDTSIYYYSKAIDYNPNRFQYLNQVVADFYFDKNDLSRAEKYYAGTFKYKDGSFYNNIERFVTILVGEKKFSEAREAIKLNLSPLMDKALYDKLMNKIFLNDNEFQEGIKKTINFLMYRSIY